MKISDEEIPDILQVRDRIAEKIEKHKEEIELLEKNLQILNSIVKQSSFSKASELMGTKQPTKSESIPITKGTNGEIIANAVVTPDQVSIILNDDVGLGVETPPLRSFFLDRIIGEMKKKDALDVKNGTISPEFAIDYVIKNNGSNIHEIIIKNYREKERINEIINTAAWSLSRMIDNSKK